MREFEKKLFGENLEKLGQAERKVLEHSRKRKTVSTDAHAEFLAEARFADRLADAIARIGGSWGFILGFFLFLIFWAVANTILLTRDPFDPYPFIFLNLLLSMTAAIQAPIIMMSQNRQSSRDRFIAAKDYEVNLKAELEVLALHEKIDLHVLKELKEMQEQIRLLTTEIRAIKQQK